MRPPSVRDLEPGLRRAAVWFAERLAKAGHQAWLVGGSVRDLALERAAEDLDLATDAVPREIERIFEGTHAVGRAFGTVVVPHEGRAYELTTFRTESGYSDGRRPDSVRFGKRLEEDARRRDFTCNALYLDPLQDELRDPTGGLGDLEAGLLRAVGEARQRFREDGLRVLRLARFAAVLGLEVEPATRAAAREEVGSLAGVSPERVALELDRILRAGAGAAAVRILADLGALAACLPRTAEAPAFELRLAALAEVDRERDPALSLAALFDPGPGREQEEGVLSDLDRLRPSRRLRSAVGATWDAAGALEDLEAAGQTRRSALLRWARRPRAAEGEKLARARALARGQDPSGLESVAAAARSAGEIETPALVTPALLRELGVPPGPAWGELLDAGRAAQEDGELRDADQARRWVGQRLLSQEGGKRPRSQNDSG